jgi:hypothetical protein
MPDGFQRLHWLLIRWADEISLERRQRRGLTITLGLRFEQKATKDAKDSR